jgi:N-acetylglucosamine malate deacetylase 1
MSENLDRREFLAQAAGAAALVGAVPAALPAGEEPKPAARKTILAIGAHMDDCEIGTGGLIAKAIRNGHRVVVVNLASDYSTFRPLQGREKEVRERVASKAREMGVEKRYLEYPYQQIPRDQEVIKRLAREVIDVRPDITLFHNPFDNVPSDHATVGYIGERAVRDATRILGTYVPFSQEMYTFEIYPRISEFKPDTFIDITGVIGDVVQAVNYFDEIYAGNLQNPQPNAGPRAKIWIDKWGKDPIPLWTHGDMKLTTAAFRGWQCGARYAEAYMALDPLPLGKRTLETILGI